MYKEVVFRVVGPKTRADKVLMRELDALAEPANTSPLLAGCEPLQFMVGDDGVFAFPKLAGDPHNFAVFASAFVAMSKEKPALTFEIDAGDGQPWRFRAGKPTGKRARTLVDEVEQILRTPREAAPAGNVVELAIDETDLAFAELAHLFERKRTGQRWFRNLPRFAIEEPRLRIETDGSQTNLVRALWLFRNFADALAGAVSGTLSIGAKRIGFADALGLRVELWQLIQRMSTVDPRDPGWLEDPYSPLAGERPADLDASVLGDVTLTIEWNEAVTSTLAGGVLTFAPVPPRDATAAPKPPPESRPVDDRLDVRRTDAGYAFRDRAAGTELVFETDAWFWPRFVGRARDTYVFAAADLDAHETTILVHDGTQLQTRTLDHYDANPAVTAAGELCSMDTDGRKPALVCVDLFATAAPASLPLKAKGMSQVRGTFHVIATGEGVFVVGETYAASAKPEVATHVWRYREGKLAEVGRATLHLRVEHVDGFEVLGSTSAPDHRFVALDLRTLAVTDVLAPPRHAGLALDRHQISVYPHDAGHVRVIRYVAADGTYWRNETVVRLADRAITGEADFFSTDAPVVTVDSNKRALALLVLRPRGVGRLWLQRFGEAPRELAIPAATLAAIPGGYDRPQLALHEAGGQPGNVRVS